MESVIEAICIKCVKHIQVCFKMKEVLHFKIYYKVCYISDTNQVVWESFVNPFVFISMFIKCSSHMITLHTTTWQHYWKNKSKFLFLFSLTYFCLNLLGMIFPRICVARKMQEESLWGTKKSCHIVIGCWLHKPSMAPKNYFRFH